MKTISELRGDRAAAGAAYAAAAAAYAAAFIELHAHDLVLSNSNVIDPNCTPRCAQFIFDGNVHLLRHAEFLPDAAAFMPHILSAAALQRLEEIIAPCTL